MSLHGGAAQDKVPHNIILFVPDGLRALTVTPQSAPTMAAIRDRGVNFTNPHSMFPTFTTANAASFATGHYPGDTGDFSNTIYAGYPVKAANGSMTPFLESNPVLGDVDQHFEGNYLDEDTVLLAARHQGYSAAAIGKVGPVLIFDHTERSGEETIIVDDQTGSPAGIPLSQALKDKLTAAGLPLTAPGRGDNGKAGDFKTPGTTTANTVQQAYFANVTAKVVLPMLKARNKPFVLVFWSRDPDGTQHNQGDSLNALTPGINGPTSAAAIRNADENLKQLQDALIELGLADDTNIVIAADHGFSTISKESATSPAAKADYPDAPKGALPSGFLAIDVAQGLGLPLFDPDNNNVRRADERATPRGNGLIGPDPTKPDVVVAANGGSDLIYVPGKDRALVRRIIDVLLAQDYVSGLFVDDDLGDFAGTLPLSAINLKGTARTPRPTIAVNFRSFSTGCAEPLICTAEVADSGLQQGQGMHGSFSRADTMNFMAATGPDFKRGFVDEAPVSNADMGQTLARLLGLKIPFKGGLLGRVVEEALPDGAMPAVTAATLRSSPSAAGLQTLVQYQQVGSTRYFDAAGFPGRTVGLSQ
ncbi:MAG TPA: nucleotide pyrophosphatase/phosphodiesterase family protein [Xanthobacteraceae bacterium]|nr:nucleotide pyrophosphatase/phosphodiesterase family protein [Xanthobacteraceae bacterium]